MSTNHSVATESENGILNREKLIAMIEEKCAHVDGYEGARREYQALADRIKGIKVLVDPSTVAGMDDESKNHILGKRILEAVMRVVENDEILRFAVEEDVDVGSLRSSRQSMGDTVSFAEMKMSSEPFIPDDRMVAEFDEKLLVEEGRVADDVARIMTDTTRNNEAFLRELWTRTFKWYTPNGYKTPILTGGLIAFGEIDDEVINRFNEASDRSQSLEFLVKAKGKRDVEALEEMYCNTIWEIEDNMPTEILIGKEPIETSTYRTRIGRVEALIKRKWNERKVIVSRMIRKRGTEVKQKSCSQSHKEVVIAGIQRAMVDLSTVVSTAANSSMKALLNRTFCDTGRSQQKVNCLDRSDLAGIVAILRKNFTNVPMSMVFMSLKELFEADVDGSPQKVVDWVNAKVGLWSEFGLIQYLSYDMLFSLLMVSKLKNAEPGKIAFQKVLNYLRERPEAFTPERLEEMRSGNSEMRLLQIVIDTVGDDTSLKKFSGNTNSGKRHQQSQQSHHHHQKSTLIPGTVQANAVGVEVSRDDGKFYTVGGRRFPYTSTVEVCAKCESGDPHSPRCFTRTCDGCGMYGHQQKGCNQQK